jgi:2-dehydro-3-deoxygalactonokinase
LFLLEDGVVADSCNGPGIAALASVPAASRMQTLASLVAPWTDNLRPIQVVLCGMAGSRNGLFEVPYARLPADCAAWARESRTLQTGSMHITIAAGVCSGNDVMRGEETQIFGAMQLDPELGNATDVVLLPGTHSKWVEVSRGSISRFRTAITGELYALLHDHSTLLKTGGAEADADGIDERDSGFHAGTDRSPNLEGGLLAALFEVRAAQLLEQRSKSWAAGFLSGLLICHEIVSMSEAFWNVDAIRIIGEPALIELYQTALAKHGIEMQTLDGASCAIAGLRLLHEPAACKPREQRSIHDPRPSRPSAHRRVPEH